MRLMTPTHGSAKVKAQGPHHRFGVKGHDRDRGVELAPGGSGLAADETCAHHEHVLGRTEFLAQLMGVLSRADDVPSCLRSRNRQASRTNARRDHQSVELQHATVSQRHGSRSEVTGHHTRAQYPCHVIDDGLAPKFQRRNVNTTEQ